MNNISNDFKLNRIQRKAIIRRLQGIVINRKAMMSIDEKMSYPDEVRIDALYRLTDIATVDEVVETANTQLDINPEDTVVNQAIMDLMVHGFKAGIQELADEE